MKMKICYEKRFEYLKTRTSEYCSGQSLPRQRPISVKVGRAEIFLKVNVILRKVAIYTRKGIEYLKTGCEKGSVTLFRVVLFYNIFGLKAN